MAQPLIGLTTYVEPVRHGDWTEEAAFAPTTYLDAVGRAGGTPLLLPPSGSDPHDILRAVDAMVVIGGPDVDPLLYGAAAHRYTDEPRKERDEWEIALCRDALDLDVPFLAICRGLQILNVALGGTLHQHLEEVVGHTGHLTMIGQMSSNPVQPEPGTRLAAILPGRSVGMCHHHQAIDRVAPGLQVTARAVDGTVEAVELPDKEFALGVQWHPEEDPRDDRLVAALVASGRKRANRR